MEKSPSDKMFYKSIRIRFADCWDSVKNLPGMENDDLLRNGRGSNFTLGTALQALFSFYAGRILEDAEETGLYTGPAQHRVKTILSQYVTAANTLILVATNSPKQKDINKMRRTCYDYLNSLGCSLKRAHEIYSKKE